MIQSRRELRLQRESKSPSSDSDIVLHPEVLRAVATKMRTRVPYPSERQLVKNHLLSTVYHEFVDALISVADDTEDKAVKFIPQQEVTNGPEGSNRI